MVAQTNRRDRAAEQVLAVSSNGVTRPQRFKQDQTLGTGMHAAQLGDMTCKVSFALIACLGLWASSASANESPHGYFVPKSGTYGGNRTVQNQVGGGTKWITEPKHTPRIVKLGADHVVVEDLHYPDFGTHSTNVIGVLSPGQTTLVRGDNHSVTRLNEAQAARIRQAANEFGLRGDIYVLK